MDFLNWIGSKMWGEPQRILFVVGPPRSGTTLLQGLLSTPATHPLLPECTLITQVIEHFHNTVHYCEKKRFHAFCGSSEVILPHYRKLVFAMLNQSIKGMSPKDIVQKDPMLSLYVDLIPEFFTPERARVFGIIRHPLDCVASYIKTRGKTLSHQEFQHETDWIFNFYYRMLNTNISSDQFLLIRYEDLVNQDEETFGKIEDFAQFAINRQGFGETKFGFERSDACFSENYGGQLISSSLGKYRGVLNEIQIAYVRKIFRGILDRYFSVEESQGF